MDKEKTILKLPSSIWILGLTGFLLNLSVIMVFSQMPMFMKVELGATESQIGIIDGFVEFISYAVRILAGSASDLIQGRKLVLGIGYGLATFVKPFFVFSSSVMFVIVIRSLDRLANGIQASPRDALIGDLAPPNQRGASYGLYKSLKTAGSVVASVLVIWIMTATNNNFRFLFMLAFIPSVIALILFIVGVREPRHRNKLIVKTGEHEKKIKWKSFLELKSGYWKLILLLSIFELAHFGESYLIFRAEEVGVPISHVSSVLLFFNLGQVFISFPLGALSDKFQRRDLLLIGILFMVMANICMMYGSSPTVILIGTFLWGAQLGATQSIFVSMISDESPQYIRGTAFGIFYLVMGLDILIASKLAGFIWENYGSTNAFFSSACVSVFSIFCLFILVPRKKKITY